MKIEIALLIILVLLPINALAVEVYLFGKNTKDFKTSDTLQIFLGMAASGAIHEIGHMVALEANGVDYERNGLTCYYDNTGETTENIISIAGFLAQTIFNAGAQLSKWRHTPFVFGSSVMATVHPLFYPRDSDDYKTLEDNGKSSDAARIGFTALNAAMTATLIRIEWN